MSKSNLKEKVFQLRGSVQQVTLSTGDVIELRPPSYLQRAKVIEQVQKESQDASKALVYDFTILTLCAFDPEDGTKLFNDPMDARILQDMPVSDDMILLCKAAQEVCGFGTKATDESKKN